MLQRLWDQTFHRLLTVMLYWLIRITSQKITAMSSPWTLILIISTLHQVVRYKTKQADVDERKHEDIKYHFQRRFGDIEVLQEYRVYAAQPHFSFFPGNAEERFVQAGQVFWGRFLDYTAV